MTEGLRLDSADGVLTITIDRPEQKNAMSLEVAIAIAAALDELDSRDDLSVGVLTGAGGTFCAGMDLARFKEFGERPFAPGRGFGGITERPPEKPIIAAVEGWALGGGFEMALACDFIVAGQSARFGTPEVKRGLVARGGAMLRLAERVPRGLALELLMTGEPIGADRAVAVGLVNHVTPEGEALAKATELARLIAGNAPLAVRTSKLIVRESRDWPADEAFARQAPYSDAVFDSEDAREGVVAFAERRPPRWQGR